MLAFNPWGNKAQQHIAEFMINNPEPQTLENILAYVLKQFPKKNLPSALLAVASGQVLGYLYSPNNDDFWVLDRAKLEAEKSRLVQDAELYKRIQESIKTNRVKYDHLLTNSSTQSSRGFSL